MLAEPARAESAVAGLVVGDAFDAASPVSVDTLVATPDVIEPKKADPKKDEPKKEKK